MSRSKSKAGPRSRAPSRRSFRLLAMVPMVLAGIAYWNALDNPFVYDDHLTITGNSSLVEPIDVKAVLLHFTFRPIVNASYAIDRVLWGPGPRGFHVTNLLLHLLNVALVWSLARRLFRDRE